jgi:chromosome segregation ATPase
MPEQNRETPHEIASFSTVVEMQKRLVQMLDSIHSRTSETKRAVERLSSHVVKLQDDQIQLRGEMRREIGSLQQEFRAFRQEVTSRFEAVGKRFDDVDTALDALHADIKEARTEIVAQNMQTLNAIQEAANVRVAPNELSERVEDLRGRLG